MTYFIDALLAFYYRALPDLDQVLVFTPLAVIVSVVAAGFTTWWKQQKKWQTPYTRKIFHFIIFTCAAVFHVIGGLPAVMIFGTVVAGAVLVAVYKGGGFGFYEALARPSDQPHRTLFVVVPLLTTALGGITTNLFFPSFAFIGYLVSGWGDAIAEPVGTKWGKHRYRVPSMAGVRAERSMEGSVAVALASFLVTFVGLWFSPYHWTVVLSGALLVMVTAALIEAISTHGLDNFTVQVAATAVLAWYVG